MSVLERLGSNHGRAVASDDDGGPGSPEGRSAKMQQFGVKLIWPGVGDSRKATTVLYGSICTPIEFDRDPQRECVIGFEFEARAGVKKVTITGEALDDVHDYLSQGRRVSIIAGGRVHGILVEDVAGDGGRA